MVIHEAADAVVIGAGVVGLATGLALRSQGRQVVLIDPHLPGSGASYGNAGTVAPYGCIPVGTPDVLKALPRLLFHRDSPLSMPLSALPGMAPWLLRFAHASLPAQASAGASALAGLLSRSLEQWERLWDVSGSGDLVSRGGCLYVYGTPPDPQAFDMRTRDSLGVRQQFLTAGDVAAMEPALAPLGRTGLFFPDAAHLSDPAELMRRLAAAAEAAGVALIAHRVDSLVAHDKHVLLSGPGVQMKASQVVIAAGAHSRALAAQAGDVLPLDTERGYHLEYATDTPVFSRPVCPAELGFYMTPMAGRLRVAGTVEFGGVQRLANPRRFDYLDRGAHQVLPDLGTPSAQWLGFRPSMPDSLPVIGRASGCARVLYAFGHGHLGLTLAAVTASLVADLMADRVDERLIAPFSPRRFGWRSRRGPPVEPARLRA